MRIVAVDPGGTTGIATYNWDQYSLSGSFGQYSQIGPAEHHGLLWIELIRHTAGVESVIICESYQNDNKAAPLVTVEYIGTVKTFADRNRIRVVMQNRNVKTWATRQKLKAAGALHGNWYTDKDAVSAQGHILYYICHNTYVDPELKTRMYDQLRIS